MYKERKERTGIMLCYPFEEKRLNKWSTPYVVQPKLDGVRCRAILNHGEVRLLSSSETEILSVPHINQVLSNFCTNTPHLELDGELYRHGLTFEDINSAVSRTVNISASYEDIEYHIFDIVTPEPQYERLRKLSDLRTMLTGLPYVQVVDTYLRDSLDDIMFLYDELVEDNYEGIIVRHIDNLYIRRRSTYLMKFKPKKSDFYRIVNVTQMMDKYGNPKEMLGALVCYSNLVYPSATMGPDEKDFFQVGSGMTLEFRREYWPMEKARTLIGKMAEVKYQHLTPYHLPRFPVLVNIL